MKRFDARSLDRAERAELLETVNIALDRQELSLGEALRLLRAEYLGKSRAVYADMVGLSAGALARLESDQGNPTVQTLNQAFQPFGYRVGLLPIAGRHPRVEELPDERYRELLESIRDVLALNPRGR